MRPSHYVLRRFPAHAVLLQWYTIVISTRAYLTCTCGQIDTGTTLILGPPKDVETFWSTVGGARMVSGSWQIPCNRAVAVGLVFGDDDAKQTFYLDPSDVSWLGNGHDDGQYCMGGIQANAHVSTIQTTELVTNRDNARSILAIGCSAIPSYG